MPNVALVGLLAGSLFAAGSTDAPSLDRNAPTDDPPGETVESVQLSTLPTVTAKPLIANGAAPVSFAYEVGEAYETRTITNDNFAFGRSSDLSPIKLWVEFGYGKVNTVFDPDREEQDLTLGAFSAPTPGGVMTFPGSTGEIVSQRLSVGTQINFIDLANFSIGIGGEVNVAQNTFSANDGEVGTLGIEDLESGFGLQGAKVFGQARGRVVGVHGGYVFDLGSEREYEQVAVEELGGAELPVPTTLSTSDGRDAYFVGADFDYPSERFRLFGGIDYYVISTPEEDNPNTPSVNEAEDDIFTGDNLLNFTMGAGFRASIFEVGTGLQIQTRLERPVVPEVGPVDGVPGYAATLQPYVRISPPNLPASFFLKGAVSEEYSDFGYTVAGDNSIAPRLGGTIGVTIGFE